MVDKRKNGTDAKYRADAYADLRAVPRADIYAEHCAELYAVVRAERKTMRMQDFTVRQKGHYRCKATTWYAVQSLVQSSVQMFVQKKMAAMQIALQKWFAEMKKWHRCKSVH